MAMPPVVSADEWRQAREELLVAEKEATRAQDALAAATAAVADGRVRRVHLHLDIRRRDAARPVRRPRAADGVPVHGRRTRTPCAPAARTSPTTSPPWTCSPTAASPGQRCRTCRSSRSTGRRPSTAGRCRSTPRAARRSPTTAVRAAGSCSAPSCATATRSTGPTRPRSRGVDRLLFVNNMQDLAVYGRQEDWEDSPEGWPQHPTYG